MDENTGLWRLSNCTNNQNPRKCDPKVRFTIPTAGNVILKPNYPEESAKICLECENFEPKAQMPNEI